jgi:hypothetical protein
VRQGRVVLARALTLEALLRAADRLRGAEPGADGVPPGRLAGDTRRLAQIRSRVLQRRWTPGPLKHRAVAKRSGGTRTLSVLPAPDRIIQAVIQPIAAASLDHALGPHVHGWRTGRSCAGAIRDLARQAGTARDLTLVQADLTTLFDLLPHTAIERHVLPRGDEAWSALHRAWMRAWPTSPGRGIPQGASLSPLIANLVLAGDLDEVLEAHRRAGNILGWIRYGDDIVVAAAGTGAAVAALEALRQGSVAAAVPFRSEKVHVLARAGELTVLGCPVRLARQRGGLVTIACHVPQAQEAWLTRLPKPAILCGAPLASLKR